MEAPSVLSNRQRKYERDEVRAKNVSSSHAPSVAQTHSPSSSPGLSSNSPGLSSNSTIAADMTVATCTSAKSSFTDAQTEKAKQIEVLRLSQVERKGHALETHCVGVTWFRNLQVEWELDVVSTPLIAFDIISYTLGVTMACGNGRLRCHTTRYPGANTFEEKSQRVV